MARREAGEGSIYKRIINSQVYWTAQVYTHKDPITDKWKKKHLLIKENLNALID
ncbi:MAG: hypothetical protein MR314_01645 [Ezakiella sp.]|nr:hypothetical protein [Ezakiella sp.]